MSNTLVVEKNPTIGTGRMYIGAIDTAAQKAADAKCDKMTAVNELARYASNRCDEQLLKLWADRSGEAIDFLADELAEFGITHVAETDLGEGRHGYYDCPNVHTKFIIPDNENYLPYLRRRPKTMASHSGSTHHSSSSSKTMIRSLAPLWAARTMATYK